MTLKLTHQVTHKVHTFEVEDSNTSVIYYNFNLTLENDLDEGQYDYLLLEGEDILARGIVQIGDFKPEKTEYKNKNDNGYIVYGG